MELSFALEGMLKAQAGLRSSEAISNPTFLSKTMMTLSSFTSAVEEHLAGYEKEFEVRSARELKIRLIDHQMKVTQAEREVDIKLAELKGQIKYLTRLVKSAWAQVGVIQSRYNHLIKEATTQI